VATPADAQGNIMPSKFSISRIFQPYCTSVDVSDYTFSVHFGAVRRASIAKLTVILELPATFKAFLFPSCGRELWVEREVWIFRAKESLMVFSFLNLNQTASISKSLCIKERRKHIVFTGFSISVNFNIVIVKNNTKIS